jgi:DeoR family transcriptional regulator, aga operon transcriptional repressor
MSRNERLNRILELVSNRGELDVETAVKQIGVSAATIRRDFDELASRQLVTRTHGGVSAVGKAYELPIRYKTAKDSRGKARIVKAAAQLVENGYRIGLNGGTTTTGMARELALLPKLRATDGDIGLTVVTNALNIATEMVTRPYIKIVVTGGIARPQSYELIGNYAETVLDGLALDIAFLGVNAFDTEIGASANHEGEAKIGQLLANAAKRVIVLTTSDKVGTRAFARICKPEQVSAIMIDEPLSPELEAKFHDAGIEVIVCD